MGGLGYMFMGLGGLLFLMVLGLVAFAVFRALNRTGAVAGTPPLHPERVLADRYARGEIDDEEYRRRLGILRGDTGR